MIHQHTYSITEPTNESTSLSVVHETERKPTLRERITDAILFWRTPPRRTVRTEMTFPDVKLDPFNFELDSKGRVTTTMSWTAHYDGHEPIRARLVNDWPKDDEEA